MGDPEQRPREDEAAEQALDEALADEAMKKSGLIWVEPAADLPAQAVWHVWVEGRAYVLTGPGEQPDPGLVPGQPARVIVRSKDNAHRLVSFAAEVATVSETEDDWGPATAALAAGRLNLRDAEGAPARWSTDAATTIYRLTPDQQLHEGPGRYDDASGREAPVATSATTTRRRPWVLHRRGGSGRALS